MEKIAINQDNCIKCLRCVRVCPAEIFVYNKEIKKVNVRHPDRCISCGHCVDACADHAVVHAEFPVDKVHLVDYSLYPSAAQMKELINARRSNRAFSKDPIAMELLDAIVEAAYRAPTAENKQEVSFTLITNPKVLQEVSRFTMDTFTSILNKLNNPVVRTIVKWKEPELLKLIPLFKEYQQKFLDGNDFILRDAKALLLIHTPIKSRFGDADSNLAYQNGSLMAEVLGVSQFYTGFVLSATRQRKQELEKLLGIDGVICAGMAMGMPAFRMTNYSDRKALKINKIL